MQKYCVNRKTGYRNFPQVGDKECGFLPTGIPGANSIWWLIVNAFAVHHNVPSRSRSLAELRRLLEIRRVAAASM